MFATGARGVLAEAGFDPVVVDAGSVVAEVVKRRPEAVLLDADVGSRPYAADLVATLATRAPDVAVVVLVRRVQAVGIVAAMEAGAKALVHRQCTDEELVAAVQAALRGQNWVAAPLAGVLRGELLTEVSGDRPKDLSPRELEVLRGLASGASNAEIGRRLGISDNTVRNHVHSLMGKLGVANRTDAVATGLRRGLVELPG